MTSILNLIKYICWEREKYRMCAKWESFHFFSRVKIINQIDCSLRIHMHNLFTNIGRRRQSVPHFRQKKKEFLHFSLTSFVRTQCLWRWKTPFLVCMRSTTQKYNKIVKLYLEEEQWFSYGCTIFFFPFSKAFRLFYSFRNIYASLFCLRHTKLMCSLAYRKRTKGQIGGNASF